MLSPRRAGQLMLLEGPVPMLNDEEEHVGPSRERRAGGSEPAQFLHTNTAVRLHPLSSKRSVFSQRQCL